MKQNSEQIKAELKTNLDDTTRVLKLQTLSLYYVLKAGEEKADIDSSYIFARQADLLSRKVNYDRGKWMSLILYSKIFQEGDNSSKGIRELKKAFAIAHKNNILWLKGEAYRELTNYYEFNKTECLIRLKIIEKAYKAFKKGGSKQQIADILVYYGAHYHYSGNFKAALQKFNEAKNLYEDIGNKDQMQNLYHYMARTYSNIGLYTEAIKYELQSIKIGERSNDIFSLTINYMSLALSYYRMENYEMALNYHRKVFDYSLEMDAPEISPFYNASYIIKDLLKLGRKKEAKQFFNTTVTKLKIKNYYDNIWLQICYITFFDDLQNYNTSNQACGKLIKIQKTNKNIISEMINIEINNNIVTHLFKIKNYELATEYLNESIKVGKSIKDINMIINGDYMKFKLDSATGNYMSAISHLRKYEKAKDSIFNDVKFYQISNLQIKYETEKKDKDIHVLTNQSELQKVKINNDKIIKIVAGVILILLLIITILIFRSYKNKKESNEKLQAGKVDIEKKNKVLKNIVKEKEWLLKELHHRVKNNLQVVMSLLNTQSSYLKDEYAVDAIKNSQNRIYSMSLIHQRLYQSDGLSCV
ncbi:histidine kinase dimerization/phosphoacceptor domain -containing protein, partial [Flavobacterium aquidurense]|uniref:tetratricopeptide repeat-containing sensor histidine kinase n=1 Tax=Flavobacterium aquidurense TaxID=362413 RepID=UPI0028599719